MILSYSGGEVLQCGLGREGLADGEVEGAVGEGLVVELEVPPFAATGGEAGGDHGFLEEHAVGVLLGCDGGTIGGGDAAEEVEGATHVDVAAEAHVEDGEVEGAAACVGRLACDVAVAEDVLLGHVGVEVLLHLLVVEVGGPAEEMVDGALGAVGVEDFEEIAFGAEVVGDTREGLGGLTGADGNGALVAVDAGADEIEVGEIADVEEDVGDDVGEIDKAFGEDLLVGEGVDGEEEGVERLMRLRGRLGMGAGEGECTEDECDEENDGVSHNGCKDTCFFGYGGKEMQKEGCFLMEWGEEKRSAAGDDGALWRR